MNSQNKILVTSHVSRDFLQNAAYFSTLSKVIWEYVSNSLDNAKENKPLEVVVDISKNTIVINDNGIGMSREGLKNFFTMHGENIKRKTGKK
ncbi:MAG: ATP-binding protein, partial [Asgard group archaeon]|nr:ATP-binding protein [Asgard group archaeon]